MREETDERNSTLRMNATVSEEQPQTEIPNVLTSYQYPVLLL